MATDARALHNRRIANLSPSVVDSDAHRKGFSWGREKLAVHDDRLAKPLSEYIAEHTPCGWDDAGVVADAVAFDNPKGRAALNLREVATRKRGSARTRRDRDFWQGVRDACTVTYEEIRFDAWERAYEIMEEAAAVAAHDAAKLDELRAEVKEMANRLAAEGEADFVRSIFANPTLDPMAIHMALSGALDPRRNAFDPYDD